MYAFTLLLLCQLPPLPPAIEFSSRASNDAAVIRATTVPAALGDASAAIASTTLAATAEPHEANASAVVSLSPTPPPSIAEQMLDASFAMRTAAGRYGQRLDSRLTAAAQEQATHLAATGYPYGRADSGHYWGNGDWFSRAQKHGFRPGHVAEVIAPGSIGFSVSEAFNVAWRGSPSHYAAILANDTSCGFGYDKNERTGYCVYVGLYGTESSAPAPAATAIPAARAAVSYPTCGPGGCQPAAIGPSYQYQRRGLFGGRR